MKKLLYMAVAAIAVLSSCDKNDALLDDNGNGVDIANAPVFTATIESDATTKTTLVEGSTAGKLTKVAWLNTDKVYIVTADEDCNQGVVGTYNVTPGTPATTATLNPGTLKVNNSITTNISVAMYPASYSYVAALDAETIIAYGTELIDAASMFNMPLTQQYNGADISQIAPMCAVNTDGSTQLQFKNIAALLAITVKAEDFASVSSIKVSSDKIMNGLFLYYPNTGIFNSLPSSDMYTDANKVTTLDCQNAGANTTIASGESKTFYVSIPPATYEYLQIEVTDGTNTKMMRTKSASITVERNKIYPITFANNYDPNLLAGVFTVSAGADGVAGTADDKKVKFTKGNLWCNTTTSSVTWAFETNQYVYQTAWSTDHVGHFLWRTWDVYSNNSSTDMPYHATNGNAAGTTTDDFWCGETHPLEVAGTQGLYVLSADEWAYFLNPPYLNSSNGRTQTNRFARARVNETNGYLIFPDGYNGETAVRDIQGIGTVNEDGNAGYPSASILPATWSAMEAAGVVFLPLAGIRKGTDYTSGYGRYWSSTPDDNSNIKAKDVFFDANGIVYSPGNIERGTGLAIRLVKTVE